MEKVLNEYADIQIEKRANEKISRNYKLQHRLDDIHEDRGYSRKEELEDIAADDSREYIMGATLYLQ